MLDQEFFSNIKLQQVITNDILSQSSQQIKNGSEVTYLFDSDDFIYPHRLVLDQEAKVVEFTIYLSKEFRDKYQLNYNELGIPDYSIVGVDEVTRNIFVERGEIYSFDHDKNLFMITIGSKARVETKVAKLQNKVSESEKTIFETEIQPENTTIAIEVTPSPAVQDKLTTQVSAFAIFTILALVGVLIGYFFWQKRKVGLTSVPNSVD